MFFQTKDILFKMQVLYEGISLFTLIAMPVMGE
jgi:hypothetical protein